MKEKLKDIHLLPVVGSLYVFCSKCKKLEDTFNDGEIPNKYHWFYHRNKWYCRYCYDVL